MGKIVFDEGEFEIAIATYNRSQFIEIWLEKCYESACERNIRISVYDSSSNDDTQNFIDDFNKNAQYKINYIRIDSSTIIGYKPMYPILRSKSKYVWVSGDSRYHDFDEMDEKVFPFVKQGIDFIVLHIVNNEENDGKIYNDLGEFLHECFISSTCIGLSIYKTAMFDNLKKDPNLMKQYDELFENNFGFAWLGYFYSEFAKGKHKAAFAKVKLFNILDKKKVQSWAKRFYGCWLEDLCQIIDNIPDAYTNKDKVPKETWKIMRLDNDDYSYNSRKTGDLNSDSFKRYKESGMIERVVDDYRKIEFYATAPVKRVELHYKVYKLISAPLNYARRAKSYITKHILKKWR